MLEMLQRILKISLLKMIKITMFFIKCYLYISKPANFLFLPVSSFDQKMRNLL